MPGDAEIDKIYRAVETHALNRPLPVIGPIYAAKNDAKSDGRIRSGPVHFLIRGDPEKKGAVMTPGFARVLMNTADAERRWTRKGDANDLAAMPSRIALANWITDVDHGAGHLLARVIVNRLWQHHLGRGIVGTPNDFGIRGDPPTHPELLDYLARELINNGWKLKPIHKLIMTSAVYMQGANVIPANVKVDPHNRLRWRRPVLRLEAESVRDALLAVGGTLDLTMYGPGSLDGNNPRRSIYLTVKHTHKIPLLDMFDFPDAAQSIGVRSVTNVSPQSLAFMNSAFVRQAATNLAKRLRPTSTEISKEMIDLAFVTVLSRRPTLQERSRMEAFLQRQTDSYRNAPQARELALADCCQVLLCLNEFIFVE